MSRDVPRPRLLLRCTYAQKTRFGKPACYELLMSGMDHKRGRHESSTALVVSALPPFMIDQVTSLRERGVTECILHGHAGVSKELLVTASDVSWCFDSLVPRPQK